MDSSRRPTTPENPEGGAAAGDRSRAPALGALLRRHRLAAGLSQEALAERAGLSLRGVSDLERGARRVPQRATVRLLVGALGLRPEEAAALEGAVVRRLGPSRAAAGSWQARAPAPAAGARGAAPPVPHNLPVQLTSFVGRERELAAVARLLGTARLVTLTGPGGVGKTRLALQAAAGLLDGFADGACFVALAPIGDPGLVFATAAQALGLDDPGGRPPLEAVAAHLRPRQLLLVLDNFEQVLGAGPALVELLAACPRLRVLATSRAALRVSGEHEYAVPPLALPAAGGPAAPRGGAAAAVGRHDAVRLFVERVRGVKADFVLADADAAAVADVCRRLDGLPLAIELAAARVRLFPPQALLARLERRLPLLTGGARDRPARHQTLRAAIAWSYDLLTPAERALFRRLAVFAGGCTAEAAEALAAAAPALEGDVLEGLEALVGQSLLQPEEAPVRGAPPEARFGLLETVREFALERLAVEDDAAALRRAHAAHYLALAERAAPELAGPDEVAWLDRLAHELDNLRAVLAWGAAAGPAGAAATPGPLALGVRLAVRLAWFWLFRGPRAEVYGWLGVALEQPGAAALPAGERADALALAGWLGCLVGEVERGRALLAAALALARAAATPDRRRATGAVLWLVAWAGGRPPDERERLMEEALALARATGDLVTEGMALSGLSNCAGEAGDPDRAAALAEESLAAFRRRRSRVFTVFPLQSLAYLAARRGDYRRAGALFEETLAIGRELGWPVRVATALCQLGRVAQLLGEAGRAAGLYRECLRVARDQSNRGLVAYTLGCLAQLTLAGGAPAAAARAVRLLAAAEALSPASGAFPGPFRLGPDERAALLAAARVRLDGPAFERLRAEGRAMTLEQAVAYALEGAPAAA
jgi:predicted ATPase/transcriptional regulator with XRE-family HTH domain